MPSAAERLSNDDYLNILAYLLVHNYDVSGNTIFDENQLESIILK